MFIYTKANLHNIGLFWTWRFWWIFSSFYHYLIKFLEFVLLTPTPPFFWKSKIFPQILPLKTFLIRMSLTCVSESVKSVASFCRSLLVKYFFRSKAFSRCWICCRVNTVLDFFFLGGGDDELLMLSSSADEIFFKSSTDDVEWPENMRIFITLSIPDKVK